MTVIPILILSISFLLATIFISRINTTLKAYDQHQRNIVTNDLIDEKKQKLQ